MAKILVEPSLRRSLSLPVLVLYGLGTTVGAGIYALTGKIAGVAGTWAPAAFLVSSTVAAFTALSFAELSSRYPKSAGEAVYLQAGFQRRRLAQLGGSLVVLSGIASSATLIQAAFGYANELFPLPHLASSARANRSAHGSRLLGNPRIRRRCRSPDRSRGRRHRAHQCGRSLLALGERPACRHGGDHGGQRGNFSTGQGNSRVRNPLRRSVGLLRVPRV